MMPLDFGPSAGIVPAGETAPTDGTAQRGGPPRIIDPAQTRDEDLDRSLRPKTLAEFVGQTRMREQLRIFVDAARQRDEPLDHALFAGPPGLGKCVTPDTMLITPYGMLPIGDLGELGGESWQPIARQIAGLYGIKTADYFYDNGVCDTLRITTRSGFRVEGTPNHPMLVRAADGDLCFRRLGELASGDELAVRLGANLFGEATRLHVEGIGAPTLDDPATLPHDLTPAFARLLGLLLADGRESPKGDGILVISTSHERAAETQRLMHDVFCLSLDEFGTTPLGRRMGQRSPRVATLLAQLGMQRGGFEHCPAPIYRAPKQLVAEFLRGVFWGVEQHPVMFARHRTIVAHLQLMLTNFGVMSNIETAENGFHLRVGREQPRPEQISHAAATSAIASVPDHHAPPRDPAAKNAAESGVDANLPASERPRGGQQVGFGVTPAGVLVALDRSNADARRGYRRGSAVSRNIAPAEVHGGASVSVAEVEPFERGRALRRNLHLAADERALAVRSVASELRPDEVVEVAWEPVAAIEPGYGHTCDVSVPDGHTFIGNGLVCHNTTMASIVASELGSQMHQTSGPALEKKADVAAILTALEPRDVLFIDEIHRLSTAIEEVLYSAMEDYQIDIVLGQGPAARTIRLDVSPFTLIGATTRAGLLTTPLRDRFGMIHRLEHYGVGDLQAIVTRSAHLLEMPIDDAAAHEIARRSRGTPRIANRLLKRVRDVAQVRHDGDVSIEVAREALQLVDIDDEGLDRLDRAILTIIVENFGGGPVGLSTLAVAVGEEAHTVEDVYEPYLLQRGFLQRTPRGRMVTERGYAHIGAQAKPHAGAATLPGFASE